MADYLDSTAHIPQLILGAMKKVLSSLIAVCALAAFLFLFTETVQGQNQFGLDADLNSTMHSADFRAFPGVPSCCPAYTGGTAGGVAIGLSAFHRATPAAWFGTTLRYNQYSVLMTRQESLLLSGNVNGNAEHSVDAALQTAEVDLLARLEAFTNIGVEVGVRAGVFLKGTFSQKELLTSPDSGLFENGTRSRNVFTNTKIPDLASVQLGATLGVVYSLPLRADNSLLLQPHLHFYQPFTNIVSNLSWKAQQLQFGFRILFEPRGTIDKTLRRIPEQRIDTLRLPGTDSIIVYREGLESIREEREERSTEILIHERHHRTDTLFSARESAPQVLSPRMSITAYDHNGDQLPSPAIRVEEFAAIPAFPLLPYVFFDDNSASLAERYPKLSQSGTKTFRETALVGNTATARLSRYRNILNYVGLRMRSRPSSTLHIVGCTADAGLEKVPGDKSVSALSLQRASAVQNYLHDVWGIALQRLSISGRNLPEHAANSATADGADENRRVELTSNDPEILAPLYDRDTMHVVYTGELRIRLSNIPSTGSLHELRLVHNGVVLHRAAVRSMAQEQSLRWVLADSLRNRFTTSSALECILTDNQSDSRGILSERVPIDVLSIDQKRNENRIDEEVSRYSLTMFDVRSAEIREEQKPMINIVRSQLLNARAVEIVGYTDRSGDARLNQQLAIDRAQAMAKELGLSGTALVSGNAEGLAYDQNKAEGRMYSRMVDVIVRRTSTK